MQSSAPQVTLLSHRVGSGKITLLNYLSGKDPSSNLDKQGDVLVNGVDRSKIDFAKYVGYVAAGRRVAADADRPWVSRVRSADEATARLEPQRGRRQADHQSRSGEGCRHEDRRSTCEGRIGRRTQAHVDRSWADNGPEFDIFGWTDNWARFIYCSTCCWSFTKSCIIRKDCYMYNSSAKFRSIPSIWSIDATIF